MDRGEQQEAALSAVADLIHTIEPGSMVTKFVVLAEIVDGDSDRAVWLLTAPGTTAWDTLGLLNYADAMERAVVRPDGENE